VLEASGFKFNRRGAKVLQRLIERRFGPGHDVTIERTVDIEVMKTLALTAQTISIGGIPSWASGCATRWGRLRN
jgi:hypothetical protein